MRFCAKPGDDITCSCGLFGVSEAGSYVRLIDSCITEFRAQGPSRTCNESKEEEEEVSGSGFRVQGVGIRIQG